MDLMLTPMPETRTVPGRCPELAAGPLTCAGQTLTVPPGRYDWLWLTVSSSVALTATAWLTYAGGLDPEPLAVPAGPGRTVRLPVTRRDDLRAVRLPDEPRLRLHEVTFVQPSRPYPEPYPGSEKVVAPS